MSFWCGQSPVRPAAAGYSRCEWSSLVSFDFKMRGKRGAKPRSIGSGVSNGRHKTCAHTPIDKIADGGAGHAQRGLGDLANTVLRLDAHAGDEVVVAILERGRARHLADRIGQGALPAEEERLDVDRTGTD